MSTETTETTTAPTIISLTATLSPGYDTFTVAGTFVSAVLLTAPLVLPRTRFPAWVGPYYAFTLFTLSLTIGHYLRQGGPSDKPRRPADYAFGIPIVVAIAVGVKRQLESLW